MSLLHRLTNPVVWALPGNLARKLRGFAEVEAESVLEMRIAAARTVDPQRRVLYLRHALDEERHARAFSHAAREHGAAWAPLHVSSEDLFERLGEERFLAFIHRGERRGRMQFESYEAHFGRREPKLAGATRERGWREQRSGAPVGDGVGGVARVAARGSDRVGGDLRRAHDGALRVPRAARGRL